VIAVVAITLALLGSLSSTSDRDVQLDAGAPVPGSAVKHRSASRPGTAPGAVRTAEGGGAPLGPSSGKVLRAPFTVAEVKLQAALSRALKSAGGGSGAYVYDLDDEQELYAVHAKVRRPPASVEKLYTTVALMRVLGPSARLHTDVLGTGRLSHGVWHGNLYLRGGGDPTFGDASFNRVWEQGYGPTPNQLVDQLQAMGIRRVTGFVYADESLFDRRRGGLITNYAPDVPDFGGQLSALVYDHGTSSSFKVSPAVFAVRQFVATMRGSGIQAKASKHTAKTPLQARLLAVVSSPPMSVMIRLMDVPSDDLFAELFAKQLGVLFGGGGTISAGARVISDTITASYDLHPTILDGSGLSRNDRSSPLEVVDLLRDVWHTTVGNELAAALPVVGEQGTVQSIGVKTAAQGHCIAKTGTLNGVSNLAGYCHSRGGHTLAFALMIDGPPNYVGLALESQMIAAIARY
jgi:D-alanyl-D-alanine carboxypeptidase/D-alanyl-D-alanine-endopeptidase (penicillin-binding protein 4)